MADKTLIDALAKKVGGKAEHILDKPLEPGERYIAQRNGDAQLLTCLRDDRDNGWVVPQERAYLFNTYECFRLVMP